MWYAVHAFLYFKYKDGLQDEYFGYENIYLIKAESVEEARTKGTARAREDEGDDNASITSNGRPAARTFAGILKIVDCEDLDLETGEPTNGTELSYSELTLPNKREFDKYVSGQSATVVIHGVDDDDGPNK
jgi:hypothetical protein